MNTTESRNLKPGDKVKYFKSTADVVHVRKNGITVGYWGMGSKEGRYVKHRVSAQWLEFI